MATTLTILALGFGLGVSLAAPPGPILAVCAERAARIGFVPGFIVTAGATTGDGTLAFLMGAGVIPLLARVPGLQTLLTFLGAALMLFFAFGAWKSARKPPELEAQGAAVEERRRGFDKFGVLPGGFAMGFVLALTSPYNFGWWVSAGTTLFQDWGALVFVGFFSGILAFSLFFTWLVWWTSGRVKGVVKVVSYVSSVGLTLFAARLFWVGLQAVVA